MSIAVVAAAAVVAASLSVVVHFNSSSPDCLVGVGVSK